MRRPTTLAIAALACALVAGAVIWLAQRAKPTTSTPVSTAHEPRNGTELPVLETPGTSTRTGIDTPADVARETKTIIHIVRRGALTPVAEAALTIVSLRKGESRVTTDATGSAQLETSALADSRVEVRAPDYCTATFSIPAAPPAAITFELIPSGKFAVHVRDTAGAPLEYRVVSVELDRFKVSTGDQDSLRPTWPRWGMRERPSQTDARGDVIIDGMPHGLKMIVECQKSRVETSLDPILAATPVEIIVATERCITGRLKWDDGSPAVTADTLEWMSVETVEATWEGPAVRGLAQKDGSFRLGPLPAGKTRWKVNHPAETVRCTNLVDGPVDVGDIVLRRAYMCRGRFVYGSHPDWPVAKNVMYNAHRGGVVTARQHAHLDDGTFMIRLLEGPATLDFSVGDRALGSIDVVSPFRDLIVDLDQMLGSIRVATEAGRVDTSLEVLLSPTGNDAALRYEYPRGMLRLGNAGPKEVVRECEGGFRVVNVPPGAFDVFMTSKENPSASRRFGRVTVTAGNEALVDGAKMAPADLRVAVKDVDGRPVADLEVEARFGPAFMSFLVVMFARTNEAGEVAFPHISSGLWLVSPKGRGPSAREAVRVELNEGEKRTVSLVIGKFGRIRGSVARKGEPASEITITANLPQAPGTGTARKAISDQTGHFLIDRVIEGKYHLLLSQGKPGTPTHRFTSRLIEVVAERETVCDIDLDAQLRPIVVHMEGKVFDDVDSGGVWTPDGYNTLQRRSDLENRWCANVSSGPAFFRIQSKTFNRFDFDTRVSPMLFAVVPVVDVGEGPIVLELRGATIVVRLADARATFPVAKLISVPVIGDVKRRVDESPIAYEDAGDVRTFRFIPSGSTITLCGGERAPIDPHELTLTVTNEATMRLEWPPR